MSFFLLGVSQGGPKACVISFVENIMTTAIRLTMSMTTLRRSKRPTLVPRQSLRSSHYRDREREEPFHVTFFKVGSTILMVCAVTYFVFVVQFASTHDDVPHREHLVVKHADVPKVDDKEDGKVTTLPRFTLGNSSAYDAFGIAEKYLSHVNDEAPKHVLQFLDAAKTLRQDFAERYGGQTSARALLERGLVVMKKDVSQHSAMADRIQTAINTRGVFHMAFGGNSAIAGCGNFFHQSFPFIVEGLLSDPLELLGLTLRVRNGAMEDIAAFPYAWCRSNFLGDNLDVASMDFGPLPSGQLETVIRNMVGSEQQSPILVFRDSTRSQEQQSLMQRYVNEGILTDPILVNLQSAISPFENVKESHLPPGFQDWKSFGAPAGAPGKVRQNMSLKQHALFGWLLSMHILSAAELVVRDMLQASDVSKETVPKHGLPSPVYGTKKEEKWSSLLNGVSRNDSSTEWKISTTQCRTAFDPVVSGGLGGAILSGTAGDDMDLLHPKGAMYYTQGWVLDLEPSARREKQLMKQWDYLGFQDYRKAYYGVPASGLLSLFLPVGESHSHGATGDAFKSLVVCESNGKGDGNGCSLARDVTFTVGGAKASNVQWITHDSVSYHGKRLCVLVDIPADAKLVSEEEATRSAMDKAKTKKKLRRESRRIEATTLGLTLEIEVTSELVTWHKGACSIAHVIWDAGP